MEQKIIIGVSVAAAIVAIFGIHIWLHDLVKFKMDESAILNFFEGSSGEYQFCSTNAIAAGTDMSFERVTIVCSKSKAIKRDSKEKESWCLK